MALEIVFLDEIDSTQRYLLDKVRSGELRPPIAVCATKQLGGIGSRGRGWESFDGNLFFSFAVAVSSVRDVPKHSLSIYFLYILKELLQELGSKVWLKWPNDLYIEEKKVAGCISQIQRENVVCGIGLNSKNGGEFYGKMDIEICNKIVMRRYLQRVSRGCDWKELFSKFQVEFETTKVKFMQVSQPSAAWESSVLLDDGSLDICGEKVYGAR